ncbi:adenylate cyclase associated N terminal-domain-containing protein [Peziza echinospora]|nr:adenylate cyclase associated N terminal-domain-containing protein [Peziza echinospora]
MANPQMHNLTTLIKRLEAATSRLEDLASIPSGVSSTIATPKADAGSTTSILSSGVTTTKPTPAPPAAPSPVAQAEPQAVLDYDAIINGEMKKYLELSSEIGGPVAEQSKIIERCFTEQRKFLLITTKAKKPSASSTTFMELIHGMQKEMTAVGEIREQTNIGSLYYDHLSAVSEGILALVWVVDPNPEDHIVGMEGASAYYGNRVMKEFRAKDRDAGGNKNKIHIEWVQAFSAVLKILRLYVKQHHPNGLTWNEQGDMDAKDALASITSPDATAGAQPPPPPPPPPPGPPPNLNLDGPAASPPSIVNVFSELNQGSSVTSRLKKVDKSEMTHKNPSLRVSNTVPDVQSRSKSPAPPPVRKPAHMKTKKPPAMQLDGNKWIIENYENDHNIVLPEVEINQSIFIHHCKNVIVQVKGKCNAISIIECTKTSVVAESLVSSIDIIKSNGFAVQVIHKLPTLQVDSCDGGIVYISKESLDVEIFTSKTTGFNVYVPDGDTGDFSEKPVPEQMKHSVRNGALVSEIVTSNF